MQALKIALGVIWILFWVYWLASAFGVKRGTGGWSGRIGMRGVSVVAVIVLLRVFRGGSLAIHSVAVGAVGLAVLVCGLALCVWARINLGRNWGMPMTRKEEPELVTSGPYRFVRHPIYTGLLIGVLGTALVTSWVGLAIAAIVGGFFYYAARVEERNLIETFPTAYPAYREHTKMLIPFVV